MDRKKLYDEVCRVLTDYEHNGEEETGFVKISAENFNEIFYDVLYKVQTYLNDNDEGSVQKLSVFLGKKLLPRR